MHSRIYLVIDLCNAVEPIVQKIIRKVGKEGPYSLTLGPDFPKQRKGLISLNKSISSLPHWQRHPHSNLKSTSLPAPLSLPPSFLNNNPRAICHLRTLHGSGVAPGHPSTPTLVLLVDPHAVEIGEIRVLIAALGCLGSLQASTSSNPLLSISTRRLLPADVLCALIYCPHSQPALLCRGHYLQVLSCSTARWHVERCPLPPIVDAPAYAGS